MKDSGMGRPPRLVAMICWLLLAAAASAQQPAFSGRTDVVLVEVPVVVTTAEGEPVRGLDREDFELFDDGRRQTIAGFQAVDLELSGESDVARLAQLPAAARRHFLLFFDLAFSSPAAVVRAQEAARRFVLEVLRPSDLAAVALFTLEGGPRLLLTFTPDRAQLARAIDTLGAPGLLTPGPVADPLRFVIEAPRGPGLGEAAAPGGAAPDAALRLQAALSNGARPFERADRDFERRRITGWSRSLAEMAERLGKLAGRKQVLYFSEGFDARLLFGRGPAPQSLEQRRDQRDLEQGEVWQTDGEELFGSGALRSDVDRMLGAFRRAGCTLYTIDVGGLPGDRSADGAVATAGAAADDRFGRDALFHLAESTGGELIGSTHDLAGALAKVLERSAVTYLLTFYPTRSTKPGEEHRLEVRVAAGPGTRVLHRPGYVVPLIFAKLHPLEKDLLASEAITGAAPRRELDLAVLAVPFATGSERDYVAVILELDGRELLAGAKEATLPVELYAYATDREGRMRAFFTEKLDLDLTQARAQLEIGLSYYAHLDLEPGDYLLRVLAREATSGRISVESRALRVPAPTEPWLSPPLFPVKTDDRLRLREKTAPTERGTVIYPFLDREKPFIPSARPEIREGEETTFFLFGQNLPPGDLEIEASLEQNGESRKLDVRHLERRKGEPEMLVLALDPQGLREGKGTLRVKINGAEGAIELSPHHVQSPPQEPRRH